MAQAVGQLMERTRLSGDRLHQGGCGEPISRREVLIPITHYHLGVTVRTVEFGCGDHLVVDRSVVGEQSLHLGIALGPLISFSHCLITLEIITGGYDPQGDWPAFCLIAVEEGRSPGTLARQGEFPSQIEGILQAGIHSVAFRR